jgi:hypothetical protein
MLCLVILLGVVQMSSDPRLPRHKPTAPHAANPQGALPFPWRGHGSHGEVCVLAGW